MTLKIRKFGDRQRVKQHIGENPGQVQQHLAEETDINNIMRKYAKTGQFTHVTPLAGEYGDFSQVPDYKTAMEQIMAADALFMELPAAVRDRFGNDPAKFIEFSTKKENLDELRKMGLAPEAKPLPGPVQEESPGAPNTRKETPPGEVPPGKT